MSSTSLAFAETYIGSARFHCSIPTGLPELFDTCSAEIMYDRFRDQTQRVRQTTEIRSGAAEKADEKLK